MNNRHKTLLLLLVVVILLWKSFTYYSVQKIVLEDKEELILLQKLRPFDAADSNTRNHVRITVYYEALCSDSRSFILRELLPTYMQLEKYVILDLVPYGKAHTSEGKDGALQFQCQHGEIECVANKVHACVIDIVKDPMKMVQMVACMIDDNIIPFDAAEKCAQQHAMGDYPAIATCANSAHASELLRQYGLRTNIIHPSFIPTVELNGEMKVPLSVILKDLKKQVCDTFKTQPAACV